MTIEYDLPYFLEIVHQNCAGHLRLIQIYAHTCEMMAEAGNGEMYLTMSERLINQAKWFAESIKPLKETKLLSLDKIDRLHALADNLQEMSDKIRVNAEKMSR